MSELSGVIPDVIPQEFHPDFPVERLIEHPRNANEGDEGAIAGTLDALGFWGAVIAQQSTGIIFVGNTRYRTAVAKGRTTLPVLLADVDDDTRDRILAADNRTARLGRDDEAKLLTLLTPFASTPKGLAGTGYDGDDLDDLVARLQGPLVLDPRDGETSMNDNPADAIERARTHGSTVAGRGLRDIILVLPIPQAEELAGHVTRLRQAWGDLSQAEIVLEACKRSAASLDG